MSISFSAPLEHGRDMVTPFRGFVVQGGWGLKDCLHICLPPEWNPYHDIHNYSKAMRRTLELKRSQDL